MENKNLAIITLFVFIGIIGVGYFILNPEISVFASFSEEKCIGLGDDCWHSLAHQTLNNTYCNKIKDNETKEHCFEHIPELNKENK